MDNKGMGSQEELEKLIDIMMNEAKAEGDTVEERYTKMVEDFAISMSKRFDVSIMCLTLVEAIMRSTMKDKDIRIMNLIEGYLNDVPQAIVEKGQQVAQETIRDLKQRGM